MSFIYILYAMKRSVKLSNYIYFKCNNLFISSLFVLSTLTVIHYNFEYYV